MKQSRIMNLKKGLTTCPTCGQQRSWDIQVCPNPNCGKRVVAVKHADGTRDVAPVDPVTQRWSSDAEKAAQKAEGEVTAAALARDVTSDYIDYLATIYGAEIHESPRDWQDMRGDLAV